MSYFRRFWVKEPKKKKKKSDEKCYNLYHRSMRHTVSRLLGHGIEFSHFFFLLQKNKKTRTHVSQGTTCLRRKKKGSRVSTVVAFLSYTTVYHAFTPLLRAETNTGKRKQISAPLYQPLAPFFFRSRRIYVFVALERIGGWMCWDVTDPENPEFQVIAACAHEISAVGGGLYPFHA